MPGDGVVRRLFRDDVSALQKLRAGLWPEISELDNAFECEEFLANLDSSAVFVCADGSRLTGFVEVSLRKFADGCSTSPVGFVEGWFVVPECRRQGIGRQLLAAAEDWARSKGCTEMGSDALLENEASHLAHAHLGYAEVERAVRFRKDL
jgi:aminoglycoside 6'-N-acetyltransferase I